MLNCETKIRPTPRSGVVQSFCHRTAWLTRVWADITTSANAACRVWREHAGPAVPSPSHRRRPETAPTALQIRGRPLPAAKVEGLTSPVHRVNKSPQSLVLRGVREFFSVGELPWSAASGGECDDEDRRRDLDAIIAETKAAIERLNEDALKARTKDKFTVNAPTAAPGGKYAILITESRGCGTQRKAVARELTTGELRQTKIVKQGANISSNDPKAWAKLAGKPIGELVKGLTRMSHTKKCIGAPNQRKFFCERLSADSRAPRCRQTVARTYSILQR
jgi:hypothetical protein